MTNKYYYKRKLPHWQPPESEFFITYRLAGSLPVSRIQMLKKKYKDQSEEAYFGEFDRELEKNLNEPHWLKNEQVAKTVLDSLLFNHNKHYDLSCACIMSNHVHAVLRTLKDSPPLNVIMQNHKKFTAVHCNRILKRTGQFWEEESFDRLIRNERHFHNSINYCLMNPVKAGLVMKWSDWKWNFLKPNLDRLYK